MKEFFINYIGTVGLCLDIFGALIMFYNTPKVNSRLYVYTQKENETFRKRDIKKNRNLKRGIFLIIIGFCLQLLQSIINH